MTLASNPFCELTRNGQALIELKQGIVLYVADPPSPEKARLVYEYYMRYCGERIKVYRPTTPMCLLADWTGDARTRFENDELPKLRQRDHWGYVFSDKEKTDSWLFMFHGYRPYSEAGKASFYRFDFDWQVDLSFLREFASGLVDITPCLSGFGGYYFQCNLAHKRESYDRMFALSRRYWGIEAHNLDVTVSHVLNGYKCVNWLTFIGDALRKSDPDALERAKSAAFWFKETSHATLLQSQDTPGFGDRHKGEVLSGYIAVAKELLPLQITSHGALGGARWDEDNTMAWIRRFTHPEEVL
jgi:hypothetical protein